MGFLDKSGITDLATRLKKYFATKGYVSEAVDAKQDKLVSGTNIKTINNSSILGSGNINIRSGGVQSVNGKSGIVNLDYSDVGALSDLTRYVTSINGDSGLVTIASLNGYNLLRFDNLNLTASDVGALPSNTAYVSTVNGQSGAVTTTDEKLSTESIGAGTTGDYRIIFGESTSAASKKSIDTGLSYHKSTGVDSIYVGNTTATNPRQGKIILGNGGNTKTTTIQPTGGSGSEYVTITLPSATGTLALESDIPEAVSDLTNDMVYDLGFIQPAANGVFVPTEEQAEDILAMWDKGLCAVTFNDTNFRYWAIKQDLVQMNGIMFKMFSGSWGAAVSNVPKAGTVALGISTSKISGISDGQDIYIGMFAANVEPSINDIPTAVSELTNDEGFTSVSVTASLSSGTKVGTVTVDGVGTDLYAPTNTDTKVTQTYAAASGYTYWRPLVIGYSSGSAEGFTPSTQTNTTYTFSTLTVQPSSGTIRATTFKGQLSGTIASSTTATTQASTDNSTKVATTAFVKSVLPAGLPSVSSSDNGKVLMVVNGAWAVESLPVYNGGFS